MKVYSSLKSKKVRDKDCKVVRRKGRVYVINKKNRSSKLAKVNIDKFDFVLLKNPQFSSGFFVISKNQKIKP